MRENCGSLTLAACPLPLPLPLTCSCHNLDDPAAPLPAPERMAVLPPAACPPGSCSLAALGLGDLPSVGAQQAQRSGRPAGPVDWAAGIRATWQFGEAGGHAQLQLFLEEGLEHFDSRSQAKTIQSQRCVARAVQDFNSMLLLMDSRVASMGVA